MGRVTSQAMTFLDAGFDSYDDPVIDTPCVLPARHILTRGKDRS